ncbi:MAG: hypothetical protein HY528_00010 [Chloroflexi bacterium]|nr:hypothetical protein [Chloroflexota bacterium]
MVDELSSFIDKIYREPYSLLSNNCIHKSLKIKNKAEEIGRKVDLVSCVSIVPIKKWHSFPTINLHVYAEIDGKKVDVSLDPEHERIYCKNSQKKLILPINISRLGRTIFRRVRPRSSARGEA